MMKIKWLLSSTVTPLFSWQVPVVLGTPTINRVVTVIKESDMKSAPLQWQASRTSYELANRFLMR